MGADLHLHSSFSDGSLTPEELVKLAKAKNLKTIALADHDTVAGINLALQAGEKHKVEVIPAIELSSYQNQAEIHILGYYIDYQSFFLKSEIKKLFSARKKRAKLIIKKLKQLGIMISYQQVKQLAGDDYIGRPHIARAMMEAGYIKSIGEAFTKEYIANGGRAYISKYRLKPAQAIKIIKKAQGIPVVAHPAFVNKGQPLKRKGILELVEYGIQGIEVYHSKQKKKDSQYYLEIAQELNLLVTGGSDFHGSNSPEISLGDIKITDQLVQKLKAFSANIS